MVFLSPNPDVNMLLGVNMLLHDALCAHLL